MIIGIKLFYFLLLSVIELNFYFLVKYHFAVIVTVNSHHKFNGKLTILSYSGIRHKNE